MKTTQAKILELNKTTIIELTDQTILEINGGSNYDSVRITSMVKTIY